MQETISKIEERIRGSANLSAENRAELLELLAQLKAQIGPFSKTHEEQAQSIAGFTEISAHEATRQTQDPALLEHSLQGLQKSVGALEQSHPQLVAVVNRLAGMLANMGI